MNHTPLLVIFAVLIAIISVPAYGELITDHVVINEVDTNEKKSPIRNNRIIRDFDDVSNNNKNPLWSNIWSIGETNNHSQSLTLNYKLPFRYFPFLDFLDGNYTYTGDFNWQRGSRAFSNVISDDGTRLGNLNTIQNANTKTLTGAISFQKLYSSLKLTDKKDFTNKDPNKSKSSIKKSLKPIVDCLSTVKRIQFSYTENNRTVLPGYIPGTGILGTIRPSARFTFGDQADIRYEAAKNGWLTSFPLI